MNISEQIENLRRIAKEWNPDTPMNPVSVTLNEAADTIESLSAKLQAENTEEKNKRIKKHLKYGFCPDCGSAVGRGVNSCFECGTILDWDLLKEDEKRPAEDCGGWIPVSKRLPENETWVLTTHKPGLNPCKQIIVHYFKDGEFLYNWDMDNDFNSPTFGQRYMGDVIAWMPYPAIFSEDDI